MPRVKLFNEDEVLEKAMLLFWKKGYADTSIQNLVDELGISRGSLYDTYGGKEDLFLKSFERYREGQIARSAAFLKSQTELRKGIQSLLEFAIDNLVGDPDVKGCFVVNATTELVPTNEKVTGILNQNKTRFEGLFKAFLARAVENGQLPETRSAQELSTYLYTLYSGLMVVAKVDPDKKKLYTVVKQGLKVLD